MSQRLNQRPRSSEALPARARAGAGAGAGSQRPRSVVVFDLVFIAATLLLSGCPTNDSSAAPARPVEVQGVAPARRDLAREIALPVELWAWQRVSIVAKVSGYVAKVPVDRGSVVKEGDLLATVTAPELDDERRKRSAEVKVAEAEVASAKANEALQTITARRMSSLVAEKAVSVQEADEANARALVARATVAQTESKLAFARENLTSTETWLSYTTIAAPFSGAVTDRWVHPGAFVSAAERTPLFDVADASMIRAVVDVPQADAPSIRVGRTPVRVVLPELRGPPRRGVVSRSAGALDSRTRTLRIEVDLENHDAALAPGMFGQAVLVLETHENALALPSSAIARSNDEPFAFVVVEGKARRRNVRVGLDDGNAAEILGGLEAEDVVVAQPRGITDGAAVVLVGKKEKR